MLPRFPGHDDGTSSSIERVRHWAGQLASSTAAARDRDREWDDTLFKALMVPGAFAGGLTAVQTCGLLTAMGEGAQDPGLLLAVTTHAVLVSVPLHTLGTDAQRERYLSAITTGDRVGALSLRQTAGGPATVRARPSGADWVLSGTLEMVPLGTRAHHFLIVAEHDTGTRTGFLVDVDTPGVRVEETTPAAMRTCPWGRLVLDGCRLGAACVLGTVGAAGTELEPLLAVLDWLFVSAAWLGTQRALVSEAVAGALTRQLHGAPVVASQWARFTLADAAIQNELVAGLLEHVANGLDVGSPTVFQDAAAARLFAVSAARAVTEAAAELAGPVAADQGTLVDRAFRDARFFASTGGGAEVQRPVVAAGILGLGTAEGPT